MATVGDKGLKGRRSTRFQVDRLNSRRELAV